jgi:peptide/nickel transport system substrate-binding protein
LLAEIGRMWIVPPKYTEQAGDQGVAVKPVGTGPYRLAEWVKGERVVLEANPSYWRGVPRIERVTFRGAPEPATRVAELVTGRAGIISEVSPEFQQQIESSGNRLISIPAPRVAYVSMDTRVKPFDDKRVRLAVNHAADIDSIISSIMGNRAQRIATPIAPNIFGYDATVKPHEYDPDRAKRLLAEAGYPNGLRTTLHFGPGRFLKDKEIAEALAGQLQKVGINVALDPLEYARFFAGYTDGSISDMQLIALVATNGDPDATLKWMDSTRLGKYYVDPQLNSLIQGLLSTPDQAKRMQIASDTQRRIAEEAPRLPLFAIESLWGVSKRINVQPLQNEMVLLTDISGQ